ncbi:MAG: hypothetical protein RLZZ618_2491 [Pseudomonadota bacterium]|jgi:hypothetical protein
MSDVSIAVHRLLVSQLTDTSDASVYAAIVRGARRRNVARGITGALVFDGERFCQLVEGSEDAISLLFPRIASDGRHGRLDVLASGVGPRHFSEWHSGYCNHDDLDVFVGPQAMSGHAALAHFLALVQRCDLSP